MNSRNPLLVHLFQLKMRVFCTILTESVQYSFGFWASLVYRQSTQVDTTQPFDKREPPRTTELNN